MERMHVRRKDAAVYLGISQRTLTNLMRRRAVSYSKLSRGLVLFRKEDLDAAIERFRVAAKGEVRS